MSTSTGREAEAAAAAFLNGKGYEVIAQNWRTRWCEIDIVARRKKAVYFVEVKYRAGADFGSGLEYITPKKLDQMRFAAEFWVSSHNWIGDYYLSAVEVTGRDMEITKFLERISI